MYFGDELSGYISKNSLKKDNFKFVFIIIIFLTIIISIFDYKPKPFDWLIETCRNFILSNTVGWILYFLGWKFDLFRINKKTSTILSQFTIAFLASILGGSFGWFLNNIFFGFYVSHPFLFFLAIFLITVFMGFAISSFFSLRETIIELANKEINEQRLLRLKTKAELEAIRHKINPHFLFNTLNSIVTLIPVQPSKAEEIVQKFSRLFRFTLDSSEREQIPLSEELEMIEEYLTIEKVRFGEKLNFYLSAENNAGGVYIPPLLLQPLVENSITHGLKNQQTGIEIFVNCILPDDSQLLTITINDTGKGFNIANIKQGFGLGGIQERLELIYKDTYQFEINCNDGCLIKIVVPVKLTKS